MGQGTSKYRKIMRTPQTGENAGKKLWYATAVSDREMSFEDFVTHISEHNSPYSRGTIHGVLHLLGYGDKTPEEETHMHALEDKYLAIREAHDEGE